MRQKSNQKEVKYRALRKDCEHTSIEIEKKRKKIPERTLIKEKVVTTEKRKPILGRVLTIGWCSIVVFIGCYSLVSCVKKFEVEQRYFDDYDKIVAEACRYCSKNKTEEGQRRQSSALLWWLFNKLPSEHCGELEVVVRIREGFCWGLLKKGEFNSCLNSRGIRTLEGEVSVKLPISLVIYNSESFLVLYLIQKLVLKVASIWINVSGGLSIMSFFHCCCASLFVVMVL
jgi:hypothetical protein